ncbi:hypothetical protein BDK88_2464 [Natrinema hispanicum]|uniref:Uncharacterized protein n=1 Tax=Natrinema hispanicum TaxID=392421 RepID=A0A482YED2_9EURY|nr:hypothetical protein BDK88_2464 [Natrinema hispanicum]
MLYILLTLVVAHILSLSTADYVDTDIPDRDPSARCGRGVCYRSAQFSRVDSRLIRAAVPMSRWARRTVAAGRH